LKFIFPKAKLIRFNEFFIGATSPLLTAADEFNYWAAPYRF